MKDNNLPIQKSPQKKKKYNSYSYALKRKIVYEIEKGEKSINQARIEYNIKGKSLIYTWLKKYGLLNYQHGKEYMMKQSPNEKIKEQQSRIEELEFQKDILLDIQKVYMEMGIDVKKFLPELLKKEFENRTRKDK